MYPVRARREKTIAEENITSGSGRAVGSEARTVPRRGIVTLIRWKFSRLCTCRLSPIRLPSGALPTVFHMVYPLVK